MDKIGILCIIYLANGPCALTESATMDLQMRIAWFCPNRLVWMIRPFNCFYKFYENNKKKPHSWDRTNNSKSEGVGQASKTSK